MAAALPPRHGEKATGGRPATVAAAPTRAPGVRDSEVLRLSAESRAACAGSRLVSPQAVVRKPRVRKKVIMASLPSASLPSLEVSGDTLTGTRSPALTEKGAVATAAVAEELVQEYEIFSKKGASSEDGGSPATSSEGSDVEEARATLARAKAKAKAHTVSPVGNGVTDKSQKACFRARDNGTCDRTNCEYNHSEAMLKQARKEKEAEKRKKGQDNKNGGGKGGGE